MLLLNGAPVWQALAFSAVAYLVPLSLGWWLYFSRTAAPAGPVTRPSPGQAAVVAVMLGAAAFSIAAGGMWDGAKHVKTGQIPAGADFLWAPHIMIYTGFLIMFLIAATTFGGLALAGRRAGVRDPRLWVRQNPTIGAVGLASLYGILSVPGDAIWHQIFGVDLTAWSLPHVALTVSGCSAALCALALYLQSRPARADRRPADAVTTFFLGVVLNWLCLVGVMEWEFPTGILSGVLKGRPIWLYPTVFGAIAFFVLMVARRLMGRGGATLVAMVTYAMRAGITAVLGAAAYPVPHMLPVMLLGAVLLDALPWERVNSPTQRSSGMALAFTAGYLAVALPLLMHQRGLPRFTSDDVMLSAVVTAGVCILLAGPAIGAANLMRTAPSAPPAPAPRLPGAPVDM